MSKQCKHEFGAFTVPDPDGSKKKVKFNYCHACGGFMPAGVLTPTQREKVQASVVQLRIDSPPTNPR